MQFDLGLESMWYTYITGVNNDAIDVLSRLDLTDKADNCIKLC